MGKFFEGYIRDQLKKKGIDVDKDDYIYNPEYTKIKFLPHIKCGSDFVSYDYYVEKFLVGQERINKIKKGMYDFGTIRNIDESNMTYDSLAEDIQNAIPDTNETALKHNINQIILRKDGLISRIEKAFEIDFSSFNDYRIEQFKMLKLFYIIEEYKNINLIKMLCNLTLENVDNSLVNDFSKNGNIIAEIKSEISKELKSDFRAYAKESVFRVVNSWFGQIKKIYMYINKSSFDDFLLDMIQMIKKIESIIDLINKKECKVRNKHGFLGTIYLKILQMEYKGSESDHISINAHVLSNINPEEPEWIIEDEDILIDYDKIEPYVEENIKKVATLVFKRQTVTSNDYKKIRASTDKVIQILKYIEEDAFVIMKDKSNLHLLIACYQEIINTKNEVYLNKYHGYSTPFPTLLAELKKKDKAHRASKKMWVRKVLKRYFLIHGYIDIYKSVCKVESLLDQIIIYILSIPNIDDMMFANSYLHRVVDCIIHSNVEINNAGEYLINKIETITGYKFYCHKNILYSMIEEFFENDELKWLIQSIIRFIKTYSQGNDCYNNIEVEILSIDGVVLYDYCIDFEISPQNLRFKVINVYKKYDSCAQDRLNELGIFVEV